MFMNLNEYQKQARCLTKKSKDMKIELSYQQALELVAALNGFTTWAALKSKFPAKSETKTDIMKRVAIEQGVPVKILKMAKMTSKTDFLGVPTITEKETDTLYFVANYFYSKKDSGSYYLKINKADLDKMMNSALARANYFEKDDSILQLAVQTNQMDDFAVRNITDIEEISSEEYGERNG